MVTTTKLKTKKSKGIDNIEALCVFICTLSAFVWGVAFLSSHTNLSYGYYTEMPKVTLSNPKVSSNGNLTGNNGIQQYNIEINDIDNLKPIIKNNKITVYTRNTDGGPAFVTKQAMLNATINKGKTYNTVMKLSAIAGALAFVTMFICWGLTPKPKKKG